MGDASGMTAAAPAYLKTHSQGEYVFDHGWAEAWQRAGQPYYPKLQVAVPFTPVPGRRLLAREPALHPRSRRSSSSARSASTPPSPGCRRRSASVSACASLRRTAP